LSKWQRKAKFQKFSVIDKTLVEAVCRLTNLNAALLSIIDFGGLHQRIQLIDPAGKLLLPGTLKYR
jgi:hypothetical protein